MNLPTVTKAPYDATANYQGSNDGCCPFVLRGEWKLERMF
jgi:hypothetical protein